MVSLYSFFTDSESVKLEEKVKHFNKRGKVV